MCDKLTADYEIVGDDVIVLKNLPTSEDIDIQKLAQSAVGTPA